MRRKGVHLESHLNHSSGDLGFSSHRSSRSSSESNHGSTLTLPLLPRHRRRDLLPLLDLSLVHGLLTFLRSQHKLDHHVPKVRGSTLNYGRISTEQLVRTLIASILEPTRQLVEPEEAGVGDLDL